MKPVFLLFSFFRCFLGRFLGCFLRGLLIKQPYGPPNTCNYYKQN